MHAIPSNFGGHRPPYNLFLQPQAQLQQLFRVHRGRGLGYQAGGLLGLGEGDYFPDGFGPAENRHQAVEPEGHAPVGRRPEFQGLQEKAEFFVRFRCGDFEGLKNRLLDIPAVDPDAAPADLGAVEHQVVSPGPDLPRVGGQQGDVFLLGRGKGVVHGGKAVRLGVILQQGKVGDPGQAPGVLGNQPFPFGQIEPDLPHGGAGHGGDIGNKEKQVAFFGFQAAPRWRP